MPSRFSPEQLAEFASALGARGRALKDEVNRQLGEQSRVEHAREVLDRVVEEGAPQGADRELDQARTEHLLSELSAVDEALRRIALHLFGSCAECAQPIEMARLQAQPWVTHCIVCQQQRERYRGIHAPSM